MQSPRRYHGGGAAGGVDQSRKRIESVMSRAFIREPDPEEPRCPGCSSSGEVVGSRTLDVQVPAPLRSQMGSAVYYCASPGCSTVYYNSWGFQVRIGQLANAAYPKDPDGLICPCFGFKAAEVVSEAREGRKDRIRNLLERARGPEARCWERCLDGRSCIPQIMRLFRDSFDAR